MGTQLFNHQNKDSIENKSIGCHGEESRQQYALNCRKEMANQTLFHYAGSQAGKGKSSSNTRRKGININESTILIEHCGGA